MGSIQRVKLTDGSVRYKVRYRTPDGGSRSKVLPRRGDAERFLTQIENSKNDGSYVDPSAGRVTVREYAEEWRAGKLRLRPTSAQRLDSALNVWILPTFGSRRLVTVQQDEVQEWVALMAERLAPSTVAVNYSYLASMYRRAVRQRRVTFSPCLDIELPEVVRQAVEPLTEHQVAALASAIADRYAAMLLVAAGSGLREGELWGLSADRVNFFKRSITVNRQLVQIKAADVKPWHEHVHGDLYFGPPKTPASERVVPVEQVVIDVLARHLAKYPAGTKELVFTTEDGMPIRRNRFHEGPWATAKKRAGIDRAKLVLHDLRHFRATLWIYEGRNIKQVQRWLGHKSAIETLDTYAAAFDAADDLTRESAMGMLGRIVASVDGGRDAGLTVPPTASKGG